VGVPVREGLHLLTAVGVRADAAQPECGGRLLPASFGSRTVYLSGWPVGLPS